MSPTKQTVSWESSVDHFHTWTCLSSDSCSVVLLDRTSSTPNLCGQILQLEQVQRRVTRLVPALKGLSYPGRLRRLLLPTPAFRRLRGDMIETFKITHNIYDPETTQGLLLAAPHTRTRGHLYKLQKRRSRTTKHLNSFSPRVVSPWNSLSWCVVSADTTAQFEQRLDAFWRDHPLRWDPDAPRQYRSGHRGT